MRAKHIALEAALVCAEIFVWVFLLVALYVLFLDLPWYIPTGVLLGIIFRGPIVEAFQASRVNRTD